MPPLIVESLHTITHSRPSTRPMPVMMPAAWIASSYMPKAASGENSRNGEPGSISRITRSRGSSLPRAVWRSRDFSLPPSAAAARRAVRSSRNALHCAALLANSFAAVSMVDLIRAKAPSRFFWAKTMARVPAKENATDDRGFDRFRIDLGNLCANPKERSPMRGVHFRAVHRAAPRYPHKTSSTAGTENEEQCDEKITADLRRCGIDRGSRIRTRGTDA